MRILCSADRHGSPIRPTYLLQPLLAVILLAAPLTVQGTQGQARADAPPVNLSAVEQTNKAAELARHGDPNSAIQIVQHVLASTPHYLPALKLEASLYELRGDTRQAAAVYDDALRLAPKDGDLLLRAGVFNLRRGQSEQSLALLKRAAAVLPSNAEVHYYQAQAYHLARQDDLALRAIQRSISLDPHNASIQQKYGELLSSAGNNQDARKWLIRAKHADPTLSQIDYEIGAADYKLMDLSNAEQYLTRAVTVNPEDMNAWRMLAAAQTKLSEWERARQSYSRLLSAGQDADTLLGLGECELELRDYPAAITTLRSSLRADPTKLLAHFYLSRAYAATGKTAEAQHEAALHHVMMEQMSFVRSAETEQRESEIQGQVRQMLVSHRESDALALYRAHFAGNTYTTADAYVFLGKVYLFSGATDDGLRCLHRALELDPRVRGAHTYEGILALKFADLPKAEEFFKAELANDPSYQMAIAEMGEVRYHQKNWAEAAEWLTRSKTMVPELLYMLCDADFHLGKTEDALLVAEASAAYGRKDPDFMQGLLTLLQRNGQVDLAMRIASETGGGASTAHSP